MKAGFIIAGIAVVLVGVAALFTLHAPHAPIPSTPAASGSTAVPVAQVISFKKLDEGARASGVTARKNYAIYDAGTFADFWQKAHGNDGTKPPSVDFTKNYVIGVFAGTEPSAGYSIAVSNVTDLGTSRTVEVEIQAPGDTCTVVEEQTSPYEFVTVPLTDATSLAHTDSTTKKDCGS